MPDPNWEITVHDLKRMRDAGEPFLLLDVRQPEEYAHARIDDSRLVPLNDLPAALPALDEHLETTVITLCHHGVRSLNAAAFLRQQGFASVHSLAGGIDAWSRQIDPSVPTY